LAASVPSDFKGLAIAVDTVINDEDGPTDEGGNLPPCARATDLAYIMFTSGSTGTSKGVEIPHRGIVRLVKETNYANLGEDQVYLLASSLSFDASTFEIWAPLLNGGRLVLIPPGPPSLDAISSQIHQHGITTLWLTAGLFQLMVDEQISGLAPLHQLLAGGDVLSKHHVAKLKRALPQLRLINGYGPTENTTFTCCHTIAAEDLQGQSIPIGKPIANTDVYLLDEKMNPLPPGTEGELYFGGDGLARGYFKNPELTDQKFVPSPFSGDETARLYRSGDRARYRPDGVIEFLGRTDKELKIRGYRIEPGEIEEALCRHPEISQARVLASGDSAEDKRLIAYGVSRSETATEDKLKGFLRDSLPSHLVPARIMVMEKMPVTANGKIDDRALPAPDSSSSANAEAERPPRGDNEQRMARLWEKVLSTNGVPANRSFFDLGGQSLQALKLFAHIHKEFGQKLPLSTLFEHSTIAELTALITPQQSETTTSPGLHAFHKNGTRNPLFCIHGGDGGTLIYRKLAEQLPDDRPIYTLEAPALSGESEVANTVQEAARRYLVHIRQVQPQGPYLLAGYCFGGIVAYEMAQQLKKAGQEIEMLCLFDTDNPAVAPRYLSLAERAARNWQEGSATSWAGRVGKLGGRFGGGLFNKVVHKTEKAAATVVASTGLEAGPKLQTVIIREAHDRAMNRYNPPSYNGDVILFTAEEQGDGVVYPPHLGWEGFIRGNLTILSIPGAHLTIFEEPHVFEFGKQLATVLADRQ
jgi:amino acid adenylation domain-containing protein